ncbi:DUF2271 domain-containing protein [Streptomyces sp. 3MP-14]|uniref:DUF2271 domain-containing protein n=2 Tax=Streptomyces TaxID=1883 RepID=A0A5N6A3Z3_9ACTN|nr:DUF2271 domain-containing protein [Streptomyces mimosae]KAB8173984.1 DUF2271 domain-containing protein [Streptomyces sp. 3MP-14]
MESVMEGPSMSNRTSRLIVPIIVISGVAVTASATYVQQLPDAQRPVEPAAPLSTATLAPSEESLGLVRVSYQLTRVPGHARNQVAVWIEDEEGNYVRTLFATSFTANGGYDRRPESLPQWRATSGWESASEEEIRSASRPAQNSGPQTLYWDGTDRTGAPMRPGRYVYRVEANVLWEKRVLFTGAIELGEEPSTSVADVAYLPEAARDEPVMVADVRASFTPDEPLSPDDVTTWTRGS